jgi:O-antigen/teichoic acid export membrane protein
MSKSDVKTKAIKGITWNLVERFGLQGVKFVINILLARLLTPAEFGIVGMVIVFFVISETFVNSGFGQAYIQKEQVTEQDANTVFYTNLSISVLIYVILWFAAPFIANFYDKPVMLELTRVMGVVIIIHAFSIIQIAKLTRAVDFKKKALISLVSICVSGALGLVAALKGMGVWSLVILNISERFFVTAGLWLSVKWKPSFTFSKASFKEMFAFGSWIFLYGIVYQIFDNIYTMVIGKIFPIAQVGFYSQAKKFQRQSTRKVVDSVGVVSFPVFSHARSNIPRLQNMVKKFLQHSMIFVTPMSLILIVIAEPFVILFLTDKWAPMIPYFQLLCVAGILYPVNVVNSKIYLAMGKSRLHFNISMVRNVLRIVNILIMYRFGVLQIIVGEIVLSLITTVVECAVTGKLIQYGFFRQARDIRKILLSGAFAFAAGYLLTFLIDDLWLLLFAGTLVTGGVYVLLQFLFNREVFMETIRLRKTFAPVKKTSMDEL